MLMKTDAKLLEEIEFFDELDKPSLKRLSYLLRHKEMWPKDFEWNFAECTSCAMGLAIAFWRVDLNEYPFRITGTFTLSPIAQQAMKYMQHTFKMQPRDVSTIFFNHLTYHRQLTTLASAISPEMVADRIDEYLASK